MDPNDGQAVTYGDAPTQPFTDETLTTRRPLRLPRPEALDESVALPAPPRRRVSLVRVLLLVLALCGTAAGSVLALSSSSSLAGTPTLSASWYSPYVDVTLTPTYPFETPTANPVRDVTLGFVVAAHTSACTPTWGTYYTLAQAQSSLGLDARIRQVEFQGGNPTVSFGGADNAELAESCTSTAALTRAYASVISRYRLTSVDFDIEGAAVADVAANARRAAAIAALQHSARAAGRKLAVWLTLPVATDGLQAAGLGALRTTLAGGVALTGVNLLAMDFAPGTVPDGNMLAATTSALDAAHDQLRAALGQAGRPVSAATSWNRLGVTVMVGENDIATQRFTLADARGLRAFVARHHIDRVSIWSLNRDRQCGSVFAEQGVQSNTCSGVTQAPLQFTHILSQLSGSETALATPATAEQEPVITSATADVQASSPYPIWNNAAAYDTGYKVVWHQNIYEAKWFSQGEVPDSLVAVTQSPWLLIGPVLAGEHYPKAPTLTASEHTPWSRGTVYHAGDRVDYEGYPYVARYYTKGQTPDLTLPVPSASAWAPLWQFPGEPTQ